MMMMHGRILQWKEKEKEKEGEGGETIIKYKGQVIYTHIQSTSFAVEFVVLV